MHARADAARQWLEYGWRLILIAESFLKEGIELLVPKMQCKALHNCAHRKARRGWVGDRRQLARELFAKIIQSLALVTPAIPKQQRKRALENPPERGIDTLR